MSAFFTYICTKTTADPYLPNRTLSLDVLSRDVSDAFLALSGGRFQVGALALYPLQRAVPNHLLCDGKEVPKASFPELYAFLGDTQGTSTNPNNFKLPNYQTEFMPATATQPETVSGGTVTTPTPTAPTPGYYPGQIDRVYGDVDSGGRRQRVQS